MDGRWQMAKWQMANGKWQNGKYLTEGGFCAHLRQLIENEPSLGNICTAFTHAKMRWELTLPVVAFAEKNQDAHHDKPPKNGRVTCIFRRNVIGY
jgi:hypothetical protein